MRNLWKRVCALLCVSLMVFSMSVVFAAEQEDDAVMPLLVYIDSAYCDISINGTKATLTAHVDGDADKCQIKLTLQRLDGSTWTDVTTWTSSQNGSSMDMQQTHTVTPGNTYRAKAVFKIWNGTITETTTRTSD